MIRDLKPKDIDKVMEIWLESTIKSHDFILMKIQVLKNILWFINNKIIQKSISPTKVVRDILF